MHSPPRALRFSQRQKQYCDRNRLGHNDWSSEEKTEAESAANIYSYWHLF